MKFCTYTLIDNSPDPISGVQLTPYERFQHVVRQAQWAEELGFDAYGVGERHAQRFISSSPPVVDGQWDRNREKYELLRRLLRETGVSPGARHNQLPFRTLEEFLEGGSVLVGSPEQGDRQVRPVPGGVRARAVRHLPGGRRALGG